MGADMRDRGDSNRADAWQRVLHHNAPQLPAQQPCSTPDRRWQLIPPRPKWSLKTSFLTALFLLAVITPLVFLVVHRTLWLELEAVTAVVAVLMFIYLALVLYLGVRFDRNERFIVAWFPGSPGTLLDVASLTPDFGFVTLGSDLGPLGCLVGLVVDVLFSVALAALLGLVLWIGINSLTAISAAICLPLFYFYRRSLRMIVARGRACRGLWPPSLRLAALAALGYTSWFYTLFYAAHRLAQWYAR